MKVGMILRSFMSIKTNVYKKKPSKICFVMNSSENGLSVKKLDFFVVVISAILQLVFEITRGYLSPSSTLLNGFE